MWGDFAMKDVVEYMTNREWADDLKGERKNSLFHLALESQKKQDVSSKIGAMLIFNQVIEQFLEDIIELSIYYIKAKIWPASVSLKIDFEKVTFGKMIDLFKQYATIEYNRDIILKYLKQFSNKRNKVVHHLFEIEDLNVLSEELDEYALLAEEIVCLLIEYDGQICERFCDLEESGFSVM